MFSDSNVVTTHPRRCGLLITKLLYILTQGETLSSSETTEVSRTDHGLLINDVVRRSSFNPSRRLWTYHASFSVWNSLTTVRHGRPSRLKQCRQPTYFLLVDNPDRADQ